MVRTSLLVRLLCAWVGVVPFSAPARMAAQELAPRAYVITPQGSNAVTLTWSFFKGGLTLPGAIPVTDVSGTFHVPTVSYYRSFSFFGRSANLAVGLPYAIGNFEGTTTNGGIATYRSGLMDTGIRLAVNLKGGPAMPLPEFMNWRQTLLLGVSLRVVPPSGQYDPTRVINWSIHRWAFKPEFGYSQRWGKWILDGYAGVWLFTANPESFSLPTPKYQTLSPILSLEGHLSYDVKRRLWFSLDGNFWTGGTASVEGVPNLETRQTSARIGGTASIPLNRRQSIKLSYSRGAYIRYGGDYQGLSVAWQYAWVSKPGAPFAAR